MTLLWRRSGLSRSLMRGTTGAETRAGYDTSAHELWRAQRSPRGTTENPASTGPDTMTAWPAHRFVLLARETGCRSPDSLRVRQDGAGCRRPTAETHARVQRVE